MTPAGGLPIVAMPTRSYEKRCNCAIPPRRRERGGTDDGEGRGGRRVGRDAPGKEHVAGSRNRQNIARSLWIIFDQLPQVEDILGEIRLIDEPVRPDLFEDIILTHDLAGVTDEQAKQFELPGW